MLPAIFISVGVQSPTEIKAPADGRDAQMKMSHKSATRISPSITPRRY